MRKNKVKEFLNEQFGEVRTIVNGDEFWFCASDIAKSLGDNETGKITRLLEDEDKVSHLVDTLGGSQEMIFISESGLYEVIMSKKPQKEEKRNRVKGFKKWITKEVIPALRKDGMYVNGEEDVESVEELNQIVDEAMERKILRKFGIGVRKDWSRTIEDNWNIRNKFQFATYTNELVYKPIFNKTAKQLKKEFEVEKLRDDLFTLEELSNVAKLENEICTLIEFGADYYGVKDYVNKKYKAS